MLIIMHHGVYNIELCENNSDKVLKGEMDEYSCMVLILYV